MIDPGDRPGVASGYIDEDELDIGGRTIGAPTHSGWNAWWFQFLSPEWIAMGILADTLLLHNISNMFVQRVLAPPPVCSRCGTVIADDDWARGDRRCSLTQPPRDALNVGAFVQAGLIALHQGR